MLPPIVGEAWVEELLLDQSLDFALKGNALVGGVTVVPVELTIVCLVSIVEIVWHLSGQSEIGFVLDLHQDLAVENNKPREVSLRAPSIFVSLSRWGHVSL